MSRILIIDDEEMIRVTLRALLNREGYEVETAENGEAGIAKYRKQPADLVILDIIMPEKEGIETIRELKQLSPDLKIVAMSGGGRSGDYGFLEFAKKMGAEDTLRKPFSRSEILDVLGTCIDPEPPKARRASQPR